MPRTARLDFPGLLQHVIVRGVARQSIFWDDEDRRMFRRRFGILLEETDMVCLAWALLPNHFHLLLWSHQLPLATFMRRLLTGYAVTFNLRHERSGHLFQNRYKSIVCEEEPYLLELVRYIHLNPLRAGRVPDLAALAEHAWCGHAVLLGHRAFPGQEGKEVLGRFGGSVREARRRYADFVAGGACRGHRDEFSGGGLRRSLTSMKPTQRLVAYDDRVLGSGSFVERLWREDELRDRLAPPLTLDEVLEKVADRFGLAPARVRWRSTDPRVTEARGLVCSIGVDALGLQATEVGRVLGLGRSGASRCLARGRAFALREPEHVEEILKSVNPAVDAGSRGGNQLGSSVP